jgi:AcrR family transcriptional regulator
MRTARELFAAPGINATGIAEIVSHARVSRRTLYQHFASKDDLIVAYLRELAADPAAVPQRLLTREDLTPRARLLEMFGALGEGPGPLRGDPFVAAAVELADPAHPGRRVIARRQQELGELLGAVCREAGARQPERLGRRLLVLYAGAAAAALAASDFSPVGDATAIARALLEAALD